MSDRLDDPTANEDLSALTDGELPADAVARICGQWRDDAQARAQWHVYHLIGDALRSDELAAGASRDSSFLNTLRQRLATEPVVLAPAAATAKAAGLRRRVRHPWVASAAVAAGVVAVAGVLVLTQTSGGTSLPAASSGATLANASTVGDGLVLTSAGSASAADADPPVLLLDGQLIRDARLDQYLAAHKRFGGSSATGGPRDLWRDVAADGSVR